MTKNRAVAFGGHFCNRVTHIVGREKLSLLDIDGLAGARGRNQQIGLPREKCGNLQHVNDRCSGRGVRRLVNIGENRKAGARAHVRQHLQSFVEPGTTE